MKKALILGCLAGVVVVILLIRFFPPNDDFNLDNPFWNGLKDFKRETKASSLSYVYGVNFIPSPSKSSLFIIGPSGTYSGREISSISKYLEAGGMLILADDFGSGNSILKGLGLKTRFSQHLVVDPLFRGKSSVLAKTVDIKGSLANIKSIMFNYPTSLQVNRFEGEVIATSSSFSFFDDNLNGKKDKSEDNGPFPMIAKIRYGKGKIYLISDSSLFINSMLSQEENQKFLKTIIKGKKIFIDISHHPMGPLPRLKSMEMRIYQVASRFEIRYSLFLVLAMSIVWLRFKKKKPGSREKIQNILQKHPDWDRKVLEIVLRSKLEVPFSFGSLKTKKGGDEK